MYGDFDESNPEAIQNIKASLLAISIQRACVRRPSGSTQLGSLPEANQTTSTSQSPATIVKTQRNTSQNDSPQTLPESPQQNQIDMQLDSAPSRSVASQVSINARSQRFFELCVKGGTYRRCLREICISTVSSDGEFFSKVKTEYYRKFHWIRAIFIRPVGVRYVRVSQTSNIARCPGSS